MQLNAISPRRLAAVLALSSLAPMLSALPAGADDFLVVGGADGRLYRADTETRVFEPFTCACAGPITALANNKHEIFVADALGNILTFDRETGAAENAFTVPITPTALVAYRTQLFVAGDQGTILRLDAETGNISDQRVVPTQVNAMAIYRDDVYVAGLDGAVYTAKARTGKFEYFTCFCFTDIRAMAVQRGHLMVGDQFGLVGRVDLSNGAVVGGFMVPGGFNAFAGEGGDLLVHSGAGAISRLDPIQGTGEGSYYLSPISANAMLVLESRQTNEVLGQLTPKGGRR